MPKISDLIAGLNAILPSGTINADDIAKRQIHGALLLDETQPAEADYCYISDHTQAQKFIASYCGNTEPILLVALGDSPLRLPDTAKICVFAFSVTLSELLNRIVKNTANFYAWQLELCNIAQNKPFSLNHLLNKASDLSGASFYYIDADNNVLMYSSGKTPFSKLDEIFKQYSFFNISSIVRTINSAETSSRMASLISEADSSSFIDYKVYPINPPKRIAYLFVVGYGLDAAYKPLLEILIELIAKYQPHNEQRHYGNDLFYEFIQKLYAFSNEDYQYLANFVARINNDPKAFFRFIMIKPDTVDTSFSRKMHDDFSSLFSTLNTCVYNNCLIFLVSSKVQNNKDFVDFDKLEALLKEYNAHALISNSARMIKGIYSQLLLSFSFITMMSRLQLTYEKRYILLNKYLIYCMIDICSKHISEHLGHQSLVYFCHEGVMKLTRHDSIHNSQLRDFLYYYILNDCSITKTAERLHLHRNTVIYKLNKIKEIMNSDLIDTSEIMCIYFTCLIIRYVERVQSQSFDVFGYA